MADTIQKLFQSILDRQPTQDDYKWMRRLLDALPPELRQSRAFLAEVVMRTESIRCFEDVLKRSIGPAENAVQAAIERRINDATLAAARRLQEAMPGDPVNSLRRLWLTVICWTVFVTVLVAVSTWALLIKLPDVRATRAAVEVRSKAANTLGHCLNEVHDTAKRARGRSTRSRKIAAQEERNAIGICAAEFFENAALGP